MHLDFITFIDRIDEYKGKHKLFVTDPDIKAKIERYSPSGRLPFYKDQIILTSNIPRTTLDTFVGKKVHIIATLVHCKDYNYITTQQVVLID